MRLIIIRYKVTFRNYCVITRCRYNIIYLKIWQLWCYEMSHSTRYNTDIERYKFNYQIIEVTETPHVTMTSHLL
jgi:hypothetical protein